MKGGEEGVAAYQASEDGQLGMQEAIAGFSGPIIDAVNGAAGTVAIGRVGLHRCWRKCSWLYSSLFSLSASISSKRAII